MESLFARTLCASDPGFGLSSPFFLREDQTGFCVCVCYFLRQKRLKIVQNLYRCIDGSKVYESVLLPYGQSPPEGAGLSVNEEVTSEDLHRSFWHIVETATDLHFKK